MVTSSAQVSAWADVMHGWIQIVIAGIWNLYCVYTEYLAYWLTGAIKLHSTSSFCSFLANSHL